MTASGAYAKFYNCTLYFIHNGRYLTGVETTALASGSSTPTNITLMNSIIACASNQNATVPDSYAGTGTAFGVGVGNVSSRQRNNAYYGVSIITGVGGYSNDPYAIEMFGIPPIDSQPDIDSALVSANNQLIDGVYLLEFDRNWNVRTVPSIGALAPIPVISAGGGSGESVFNPLSNNIPFLRA